MQYALCHKLVASSLVYRSFYQFWMGFVLKGKRPSSGISRINIITCPSYFFRKIYIYRPSIKIDTIFRKSQVT